MLLTNRGPIKEVNFPDNANNPKPDAWLFSFIAFVINTLLADWIGPIKKPFIDAKTRNIIFDFKKSIIVEDKIKPIREIIITDFDEYLSFAYPPIIAPIKAVIFINTDNINKSLISRSNVPGIFEFVVLFLHKIRTFWINSYLLDFDIASMNSGQKYNVPFTPPRVSFKKASELERIMVENLSTLKIILSRTRNTTAVHKNTLLRIVFFSINVII